MLPRHLLAQADCTTVKKIPLRATQSDNRIFREVTALSRLSHRFIVRYYTTWVETTERTRHGSPGNSDSSGSPRSEGMTSVPYSLSRRNRSSDRISFDLDDLDSMGSGSKSSFPSIHFSGTSTPKTDDEDESGGGIDDLFGLDTPSGRPRTPPPRVSRTLYIQMVGMSGCFIPLTF
jgi:translation initiation factor 2-alpha kinase 4